MKPSTLRSSASSCSSSLYMMTALSGVRSSWLMLARNWLLATLAASASSLGPLAASSSARLRTAMSENVTTAPRIELPSRMGKEEYSTGKLRPVLSPEHLAVHPARLAGAEGAVDRALLLREGRAVGVLVVHQVVGVLAQHLGGGEPEHLQRGPVDEGAVAFVVDAVDALAGRVQEQAVVVGQPGTLLLDRPPLGHVPGDAEHVQAAFVFSVGGDAAACHRPVDLAGRQQDPELRLVIAPRRASPPRPRR